MATLLISFDVAWETDDAAYNLIYAALQEAIKEGREMDEWWAQTTSFYVVETPETASAFAVRVWNAAKMRKSKDRLVVLDANVKAGATIGNITDGAIYALLPFVKKLT